MGTRVEPTASSAAGQTDYVGEKFSTRARRAFRYLLATPKGVMQFPNKGVSLFEPPTEFIRKGKAGKPNEFGKLVQGVIADNLINMGRWLVLRPA